MVKKKVTDLQQWIDDHKGQFIKISDEVWRYAEVGLFETKSSALHAKLLENSGFQITQGVAGLPTAVKATYGTEKPVIAILGEFDALPGLSQKTRTIKEPVKAGTPGHGCGHNLYGAACLAACIAIKNKIEDGELKGTIHYYGCPAEENSHGKTWMVKSGLFDEVDISLTWHPWDINFVWSSNFQAIYNVIFQFKGQTAHAAADPFNGRSALDAVELMNVGINYLREHMTTDARIHYVITRGGEAPNIVPDEAEVWYYVRAPRLDQVKGLYSRVLKVAKGAAMMTETEVNIILLGGSANMLPNITLENLLYEKMKEVGPPQFTEEDRSFAREIKKSYPDNYFDNFLAKIVSTEVQSNLEKYRTKEFCEEILPIFGRGVTLGGSTDVGDVTWVNPVAQFSTACSAIGTPDHSWQLTAQAGMNIGHLGMLQGAKILALATAELMQDPELVKKARDEFEEQIKITPYESPISDDASPPLDYFRRVYGIQK
jgi:aminobenzoyl-glutamate utilization protein B